MKKTTFRLFSVLLTAVMLISMVPAAAMAADIGGEMITLKLTDTDESILNIADESGTVSADGTLKNGGSYSYDAAADTLTLENAELLNISVSAPADSKKVFTLKFEGKNIIDNSKSAQKSTSPVISGGNLAMEFGKDASLTIKSEGSAIAVEKGSVSIGAGRLDITTTGKVPAVTAGSISITEGTVFAEAGKGNAFAATEGDITLTGAKVSAVTGKGMAFYAPKGNIVIDSETADAGNIGDKYISPADYSKVSKAAEKAAKYEADAELYANYDELAAALDAVDYGLGFTQQKEVDKYAEAILAAADKLAYKGADYSGVDAAIALVPDSERENYVDLTGFDAAVAAVDTSMDITQQEQVNAMAQAVEEAAGALELKPADYSKVEEALKKVPGDLSGYSAAERDALQQAKDNVVYDLKITDQDKVDSYAEAILLAVEGLKAEPANYSGVKAAVAKIPEDLTVYTDKTADALKAAADAVDYNLDINSQDKVDAYEAAILDAIDKLELKPADYKKVDDALNKVPADLKMYTESSRNALKKAQDAVDRDLKITDQKKVDGFAKDILAAIKNLKIRSADYTEVNKAYDKIPKDLSIYTNKTADALVNTANEVDYKLSYKDQDKVDAYAKAILKAIKALELKPADYSKVDAAIDKIPEDLSVYTNETADALVYAANAVDYDLKITDQKKVDGYAADIEEALCSLSKKPAEKDPHNVGSAQTGDNSNITMWVILGAAALCGMAAVIVIMVKKKK